MFLFLEVARRSKEESSGGWIEGEGGVNRGWDGCGRWGTMEMDGCVQRGSDREQNILLAVFVVEFQLFFRNDFLTPLLSSITYLVLLHPCLPLPISTSARHSALSTSHDRFSLC